LDLIKKIEAQISEVDCPFYVLDLDKVKTNYNRFYAALTSQYGNVKIAYSYKTNYMPHLCKTYHQLGAWAEVVSMMEYQIALKNGANPKEILYNGPAKKFQEIEVALRNQSIIHIDHLKEWECIKAFASNNPEVKLRLALRINFKLSDQNASRFGLSLENGDLELVANEIKSAPTTTVVGLHCHFTTKDRSVKSYRERVKKLIDISKQLNLNGLEYLDVGGGFFSEMPEMLENQFSAVIPTLEEYGAALSEEMKIGFPENGPLLVVEPGAALSANTMQFFCKIWEIKNLQHTPVAVCTGSKYNIKPTLHNLQMPYKVVHFNKGQFFDKIAVAGYTCKEDDVLIYEYSGKLAKGDYLVFQNIGAYSLVLKPPFIEADFPVFAVEEENITLVKRRQTFEDVLSTYL
jgi:diaminopimelate decarboxylase